MAGYPYYVGRTNLNLTMILKMKQKMNVSQCNFKSTFIKVRILYGDIISIRQILYTDSKNVKLKQNNGDNTSPDELHVNGDKGWINDSMI